MDEEHSWFKARNVEEAHKRTIMQSCRIGCWYLNGFTSKYYADQAEELETDGKHENKLVFVIVLQGVRFVVPRLSHPAQARTPTLHIWHSSRIFAGNAGHEFKISDDEG